MLECEFRYGLGEGIVVFRRTVEVSEFFSMDFVIMATRRPSGEWIRISVGLVGC